MSKRKPLAVLDTETTSLDDTAEVIEICIRDLNQKTLYHSYVMPMGEISDEAAGVHGIDFDFLAREKAPFWSDIVDDVKRAVEGYVLCAYNAPFDKRIIEQSSYQQNIESPMADNEWVCASKTANTYLGDNPNTKSGYYRLTDAFANLCPDKSSNNIQAHSAGDDVFMTVEIVNELHSRGVEIEPAATHSVRPAVAI